MSLTSIFNTGLSGLNAAQEGLRVVSQNIANVNTVGYARTELDQTARNIGSAGGSVDVTGIRRVVDQFLGNAALSGAAREGTSTARSEILDRAQQLFGDANSESGLFAMVNTAFASLTTLSTTPSDSLRRSNAMNTLQSFLSELSNTSQQIEGLRTEIEQRLGEDAAAATNLLSRIASLNNEIVMIRTSGGDATSAENGQAHLIEDLSAYIDIRVTQKSSGGVEIRTRAGALLVGAGAAQISYAPSMGVYGPPGALTLTDTAGTATRLEPLTRGGSLAGLMQARDIDLNGIAESLGQFAGAIAYQLNVAHNESTSVPAPTSMTGRNTGLLAADALSFGGRATIGVTSPAGDLLRRIEIDFVAGTYSVDGGAATSFGGPVATIGQFVAGMDTALTGLGDMSFANGKLTVSATGGAGIAVQDSVSAPSTRSGRSLSHFFGLNDLITRDAPIFYSTSMATSEAHALNPGGALHFQIVDSEGRIVADRAVPVTGTSWTDQTNALNGVGTGIGGFGTFTFSVTGRLTATMNPGLKLNIVGDTTLRGDTQMSVSTLFGLDRYATAGRAAEIHVSSAILANPSRLALAMPDFSAPIGSRVLETGDNTGALALDAAATMQLDFGAAGIMPSVRTNLSGYLSSLAGETGSRSIDLENQRKVAEAVSTAVAERRSSAEGVKLDDELVRMTQYQQSYAAASRVIQAAKEIFDILLSLK